MSNGKLSEKLQERLLPDGFFGIDGELEVATGYDAIDYDAFIECPKFFSEQNKKRWKQDSLSPQEKITLANKMIERWEAYRALVKAFAEGAQS